MYKVKKKGTKTELIYYIQLLFLTLPDLQANCLSFTVFFTSGVLHFKNQYYHGINLLTIDILRQF